MNDKKEKMTFVQWLDNFWYHNKTATVIGAVVLVVLVVGLSQCLLREEHDVFIYSVGHHALSAQATDEFVTEMAEKFSPDANDDGKKVVDIKVDKFTMVKGENGQWKVFNPEKQVPETGAFQLELGSGECVVYLMEPAFFRSNLDYLASFEDVLGYVPENAISGKGMKLGELEAYKATMTLGYFPEDYIICLADKEDRIDDDYYMGNAEFFDNLINCRINPQN